MAKIFKFRGKTLEELQKMSIEEFAELLTSRSRRHIKRGLLPEEKTFINKVRKEKPDKIIRTQLRTMIILPEFVGRKFGIHNGKTWVIVEIKPEMIGHRLGEFAKTRQKVVHSGPGIGATRGTKFSAVK